MTELRALPDPLHIHLEPSARPFSGPEVLAYYDGPLLFWLPHPVFRLLAVALPGDAGHWPFLIVHVSESDAQALEANKLTLRRAVLGAEAHYLLRDYDAPSLLLEPMLPEQLPEAWLPGDLPIHGD
jgi:hypothetical protein